jgi:DNA-cytosine methyltransferase
VSGVSDASGALTLFEAVVPPYRRPSMADVRARPKHGLTAVSTFSGCGGSSLGLRMAGWDVRASVEFIPAAAETYRANFPETAVLEKDVRKIDPEDLLVAAELRPGELDLLEGSPPCASFSSAGMRERGWETVKKYCVDPSTRVLRADLRWVRAGEIHTGDDVVAFDEEALERGRRFRTARVTGVERLTRPSRELLLEDGRALVCSNEHRWLVRSGQNLRWKRAVKLKPGDQLLSLTTPWAEETSRDAGWVAGMFDGEGCASAAAGKVARGVSVAQVEGPTLARMRERLTRFGFEYGEGSFRTSARCLTIQGGLGERLRFLGSVRPERLLEWAQRQYENVSIGACVQTVRVEEIVPLGTREVIALSTDAKTFIAEGILSHNSDTEQRTDDLFWEWVRLLDGLRPRAFLAENVPGLLAGNALEEYAHKITRDLSVLGYRVAARVMNSANFGVPQERRRLILLGYREDVGARPAFPSPTVTEPHTVAQALAAVDPADPDHRDYVLASSMLGKAVGRTWEWRRGLREKAECARCARPLSEHERRLVEVGSVRKTKGREEARRTKTIVVCADGERGVEVKDYFLMTVPDLDRPCPTLTATGAQVGAASVVHPTECRKFTPAEAKAISGFPADFVLTGTREQRYERIGRTVTPPLYEAIGREIADTLTRGDD